MGFRNFLAASRKSNIRRFGLIPSTQSVDWIEGLTSDPPEFYEHPSTLTGTMNGVNDTFVLVGVSDPQEVQVFWNGVMLAEGTGYTRSGGTLTMQTGYIPESGDDLFAYVWN